jgi:hypothetical protein
VALRRQVVGVDRAGALVLDHLSQHLPELLGVAGAPVIPGAVIGVESGRSAAPARGRRRVAPRRLGHLPDRVAENGLDLGDHRPGEVEVGPAAAPPPAGRTPAATRAPPGRRLHVTGQSMSFTGPFAPGVPPSESTISTTMHRRGGKRSTHLYELVNRVDKLHPEDLEANTIVDRHSPFGSAMPPGRGNTAAYAAYMKHSSPRVVRMLPVSVPAAVRQQLR